MTDLEMLRAVCDKTRAIEIINMTDFNLAKAITERLAATRPAPQAYTPSGIEPETNQAYVDRLPDPEGDEMTIGEINDRRAARYSHVK